VSFQSVGQQIFTEVLVLQANKKLKDTIIFCRLLVSTRSVQITHLPLAILQSSSMFSYVLYSDSTKLCCVCVCVCDWPVRLPVLACSITASAETVVDIWRRNVKSSDCSVAVKLASMLLKNLLNGCWRLRRDAISPLTHCYVIAGLRRFRSFHFSLVKWLLFAPALEIFHVMSRKTVQMQSFCLSSLLVLHWATIYNSEFGSSPAHNFTPYISAVFQVRLYIWLCQTSVE